MPSVSVTGKQQWLKQVQKQQNWWDQALFFSFRACSRVSLFKCEMNTKLVQLCFASNPHSSNWSEIHTRLQHWVKHCLPQATSETDEVYIRHIANFQHIHRQGSDQSSIHRTHSFNLYWLAKTKVANFGAVTISLAKPRSMTSCRLHHLMQDQWNF